MKPEALEFVRSWTGPHNDEYFRRLAELTAEDNTAPPVEPPSTPRPAPRPTPRPAPPRPAARPGPAGDLASALDAVEGFVRRFVVLPSEAEAVAVALWIAHTFVYDGFDCTPYLAVLSPEKRSGKTRLLEVVGLLCREAQPVGGASLAALFRIIDEAHPTLLLDEADTIFSPKRGEAGAEDIRGLLNNGYRRGQPYLRVVGEGKKMRVERFDPFCPKAVAAIGTLPDTLLDRSIVIRLQRRRRDEPVEPFRLRRAGAEATPIREALAAAVAAATLDEDPPIPAGLGDRAADNWTPLLAIADAAGGRWPARARRAATILAGAVDEEDERAPVRLLADIRAVFAETGASRLPTATLLEHLHAIEESPWADWRGRGLSAEGLAYLLREFRTADGRRLRAKQMKVGGAKVRGFERDDFEDAFARYLSPDPVLGPQPGTPVPASVDEPGEGTESWVEDANPVPIDAGFEREGTGVPGYRLSTGLETETVEDDLPASAWAVDDPPPPDEPPPDLADFDDPEGWPW